jgi:polyhydroxyalkanoate synthesis regulator phasin
MSSGKTAKARRAAMNADRIITQLDKMVQTGQMTADEAQSIRNAEGTPEFEEALLDVRLRHAATRLDGAVADGEMTREEADGQLQRLRDGEHPKGLRARLGRHSKPNHT